jgi:hypothetical protein
MVEVVAMTEDEDEDEDEDEASTVGPDYKRVDLLSAARHAS